jgi:hypothetical protein
MGLIDVAVFYGKFKEMKALISEVSDKELKHKLEENFQWLMEHGDCYKAEQTAGIEVI